MGLNIYDYIYLITGLFGAYVIYIYMSVFFDTRKTTIRFEFISYIIYFLIISIIYFRFNIPILNLVTNIILYFLLSFNYKTSFKNRIISVFFIYIILLSIETVVALISGYIYPSIFHENPHYYSIRGMVSIKIISYSVGLILGNFKNIKKGLNIPTIYWISIFLIPLGSLYIYLTILRTYTLEKLNIIGIVIVLFSINIITFYLYDTLKKYYNERIEKIALEDQNKYYQGQINTINNSYKTMRSLRHDIKNYLVVLKSYVEKNEKQKAVTYISSIVNDITNEAKERSNTGNVDIDSILNYKLEEAESKGISISAKAKVPDILNIHSLDIVVILGNLLDNAIEACSKVENDKKIDIIIRYSKNVLFIFTSNTYDGTVQYENGKIVTTKKDSHNHGIGLNNIDTVLSKYSGTMAINHTKDTFNVDIILYID